MINQRYGCPGRWKVTAMGTTREKEISRRHGSPRDPGIASQLRGSQGVTGGRHDRATRFCVSKATARIKLLRQSCWPSSISNDVLTGFFAGKIKSFASMLLRTKLTLVDIFRFKGFCASKVTGRMKSVGRSWQPVFLREDCLDDSSSYFWK